MTDSTINACIYMCIAAGVSYNFTRQAEKTLSLSWNIYKPDCPFTPLRSVRDCGAMEDHVENVWVVLWSSFVNIIQWIGQDCVRPHFVSNSAGGGTTRHDPYAFPAPPTLWSCHSAPLLCEGWISIHKWFSKFLLSMLGYTKPGTPSVLF